MYRVWIQVSSVGVYIAIYSTLFFSFAGQFSISIIEPLRVVLEHDGRVELCASVQTQVTPSSQPEHIRLFTRDSSEQ